MNADVLLTDLKKRVTQKSSDPRFKHNAWFVTYHLEIVEAIAIELCDKYPSADKNYILTLVWLHDFEKIIDFDNQYNTELIASKELMKEVGYDQGFIDRMYDDLNMYNAKNNLHLAPIEIQIVSSADAASHFIGPFAELYWYENPDKSIQQLQSDNIKKLTTDWDLKITLPEVKEASYDRYLSKRASAGILPDKYLD